MSEQKLQSQKELKSDSTELKEALQIFRNKFEAAAEKPSFFWKNQHQQIMTNLHRSVKQTNFSRPMLLWASATIIILVCLFFFMENSKTPTPDLAAGSDQDLLVDVEHTLEQGYPESLAPNILIHQEVIYSINNSRIKR
jgi:hypothetical protein